MHTFKKIFLGKRKMGCGASRVDTIVCSDAAPKKVNGNVNGKDVTPVKDGSLFTSKQYNGLKPASNGKTSSGTKIEDLDNSVNSNSYSNERKVSTVFSSASFNIKRSKMYPSLEYFAQADQVALTAPSNLKDSTTKQLVDYLIKNFQHSDLLKLRVIWRWITHNISYDVDSYFNGVTTNTGLDDQASNVLSTGKSVCSGYSNLFKTMSNLVGIQVECISGWSKGYAFVVGSSFSGTATNHLWNAALLDGSWWLFDCTWGAGYIDDKKHFVREYDEHFFMADPKEFIYDHFPKNPNWQLLETGITIDEYETMGLFTKSFFNLNMKPVSHKDYLIECDTGKVHLTFKIDKQYPVKCAGSLTNSDNIIAGDQYLHIYTTDKVLHVYATVPDIGEFTLKLFADKAESVSSTTTDTTLPLICTYHIVCTHKLEVIQTYPKQFKKWCHGFTLHSPMSGQLCIGETYTFKVSVTNVSKMAVCLGGDTSSVIYMDNTDGLIWEKDVKIARGTERITVVAKFTNSYNTTFSSLLEYVVSPDMCILSVP